VVGLGGGRDHDRLLHPLVSRAASADGFGLVFGTLVKCCCWLFFGFDLNLLLLVVFWVCFSFSNPNCAPPKVGVGATRHVTSQSDANAEV
jgi:hypothetical protein